MNLSLLSSRSLRSIRALGYELSECVALEQLSEVAYEGLASLIDSEVSIWNEFSSSGEIYTARSYPKLDLSFLEKQCQAFGLFAHEHPCFASLIESRAPTYSGAVSDYISPDCFKQTGIYAEHNKNLSGSDHIVIAGNLDQEVSFAMNFYRPKAFTVTEKAISRVAISLLLPVYQRLSSMRSIQVQLDSKVFSTTSERAWINTDRNLQPIALSDNCESYLTRCFGVGIRATRLPVEVDRAVRSIMNKKSVSTSPILLRTNGVTVECRVAFHLDRNPIAIELRDFEYPLPSYRLSLASLSPVEQEVLRWLALGKSNIVISNIRGVSLRTIDKQVENILKKLGFTSRLQLIAAFSASVMEG